MGLRNRLRVRMILNALSDQFYLLSGKADKRGNLQETLARLELAETDLVGYVAEQFAELEQALEECRNGNLGRWALILYERTIDPRWIMIAANGALPPYMVYNVNPRVIGSTREEIEGFYARMREDDRRRGAKTV